MNDHPNPAAPNGHGDFERRDIGISLVVYFLIGLAVFLVVTHFVVTGIFSYLEKRSEAEQTAVSPLVQNAPADTRHLSVDYRDYLKQNFPAPQLEIDERNQLNGVRLREEQILSTYDYVDQKAGTVRIPIERAMDLIAQRGLPVRAQNTTGQALGKTSEEKTSDKTTKGKKQ